MAGWIQINGKLIPKEEYHGNNVRGPSTNVMPDIEPFQSPITGELITTRPQLREHNKTHGVTNSADYSPEFLKQRTEERLRKQATEDRNDRIRRIRQQLEQ